MDNVSSVFFLGVLSVFAWNCFSSRKDAKPAKK